MEYQVPSDQRHIDGTDYVCVPFLAREGLRVMTQLTKILGGAINQLEGDDNGSTDKIDKIALFARVVGTLAERLDEPMVEKLVMQLLSQVQIIDGNKRYYIKDVFDQHFQGRMATMFEVVAFSLETNYSDFFTRIRSYLAARRVTNEIPTSPNVPNA